MERARPFSKAHCRPPRRRPKAKIFTGRLCRSGRLPLFCKSIRCAATVKAVQRALVFFSPLPPQRTRVGTAFPPGGRKQFRLGRYTVRNRRQKTGVLGPSQRQRHWQAKGRAVLQSKIPLYSKLDFTKGSADLRKNTRLLLADFSKAGAALRKKRPPATGRLCRGRRSLAKKASSCNRQTLPGRRSLANKVPSCNRQTLPGQARLCEKSALLQQADFAGAARPCWKIFALHQGLPCRKAEGGASPALLSRLLIPCRKAFFAFLGR